MSVILVIGGGPAGMTAAYAASDNGRNRVILAERNEELGKKLLLTGSGKCNYSNEDLSPKHYNFGDNHPFATLLEKYDTAWLEDFFGKRGMLTDRRDGLLYPRSERSDTVRDLMRNLLKDAGVEVITGKKAVNARKNTEGQFIVEFEDQTVISSDKLIIATGGKAYPTTGSDGGGYRLARSLGHEVTFTYPVLTRLLTSDEQTGKMAGVRIKGKVKALIDGEAVETTEGEVQFNTNALSGICIFQLSRFLSKPLEEGKDCHVCIDFAPDMTVEEVEDFIKEALRLRSDASVKDIAETMFGAKTAEMLVAKTAQHEETDTNKVSAKGVAHFIKNTDVKIDNHDSFKDAQVTRGGVKLDEVNVNMESKITKNLFFAGEVLDADGTCGGYNLHFAFVSGYEAGLSAANE